VVLGALVLGALESAATTSGGAGVEPGAGNAPVAVDVDAAAGGTEPAGGVEPETVPSCAERSAAQRASVSARRSLPTSSAAAAPRWSVRTASRCCPSSHSICASFSARVTSSGSEGSADGSVTVDGESESGAAMTS
jgi:hypothetical protein